MNRLRVIVDRLCTGEATVPISSCVHYAGFRYGHREYHPYESYLIGLVQGGDSSGLREQFISFLQHYRPQHFGEALGIKLERSYGLWHYPWLAHTPSDAWLKSPLECPDILTHYSLDGIAYSRVIEEFKWLERALESIRVHGYQPQRFGSPIRVQRFFRMTGEQANLVLDGNHRLSALSAIGQTNVSVQFVKRKDVRESDVENWPQVKAGRFTASDSRRILHAYFEGNRKLQSTLQPATLLKEI